MVPVANTCHLAVIPFYVPGYYTNEAEFTKRVEEDATSFKPFGKMIHSYSRSAHKMSRSRKNGDMPQPVYGPEEEEIVEFEVYHVRFFFLSFFFFVL